VLGIFNAGLQGLLIESAYSWYWLVDGSMDRGYTVHLANPNPIQAYNGLKHICLEPDGWLLRVKDQASPKQK